MYFSKLFSTQNRCYDFYVCVTHNILLIVFLFFHIFSLSHLRVVMDYMVNIITCVCHTITATLWHCILHVLLWSFSTYTRYIYGQTCP